MSIEDYKKEMSKLSDRYDSIIIEIDALIAKYYDEHPKEKGKENTEFYKRVAMTIQSILAHAMPLRDRLKNPDTIQRYDTR